MSDQSQTDTRSPTPSRRDFVKLTTGALTAGVIGGAARPARGQPLLHTVSDEWKGVLVDLTVCVGCRKCEWACRQENEFGDGEPIDAYEDTSVFERTRRTEADRFTVVNRFFPDGAGGGPVYAKKQCMHCFEPACASACLVSAFRKTPEGPVLYDPSVCIGCRYCMMACPFGVPAYTYDNALAPEVRKCTMCFERITEEGRRPACVEMCPVEALTFGKRSELLRLAQQKIAQHPDRYVDHIYGENEAGGTCWLYLSPVPFDQVGFRTDVGTTPYPELTKGFLSAVPLVLVMWPALLMGAYAFTEHRKRLAGADNGAPSAPVPTEETSDG